MLNVYFVVASSAAESLDWFVTASDRDTAVRLWQEIGMVEDVLGVGATPEIVFLLPVMPDLEQLLKGPHALEWHKEVKRVTT